MHENISTASYGFRVCFLAIVTLAFVYAHITNIRADLVIAQPQPHVEISPSIFPLPPHNNSTFQYILLSSIQLSLANKQ